MTEYRTAIYIGYIVPYELITEKQFEMREAGMLHCMNTWVSPECAVWVLGKVYKTVEEGEAIVLKHLPVDEMEYIALAQEIREFLPLSAIPPHKPELIMGLEVF